MKRGRSRVRQLRDGRGRCSEVLRKLLSAQPAFCHIAVPNVPLWLMKYLFPLLVALKTVVTAVALQDTA